MLDARLCDSRRVLYGLYRCAKCAWNRCRRFGDMEFLIFCTFVSKTLIHAQNCCYGATGCCFRFIVFLSWSLHYAHRLLRWADLENLCIIQRLCLLEVLLISHHIYEAISPTLGFFGDDVAPYMLCDIINNPKRHRRHTRHRSSKSVHWCDLWDCGCDEEIKETMNRKQRRAAACLQSVGRGKKKEGRVGMVRLYCLTQKTSS